MRQLPISQLINESNVRFRVTTELSKCFQEVFFKNGGKWASGDNQIKLLSETMLWLSQSGVLHRIYENFQCNIEEVELIDGFKNIGDIYQFLLDGNTIISIDGIIARLKDGRLVNAEGVSLCCGFNNHEDWQPYSEPEKWSPKGGGYFIDTAGQAIHDDCPEINTREFGIEFETKEAAEEAAIAYRKFHRLYKLADELNEGWTPDFNNENQAKYSVGYNQKSKKYNFDISYLVEIGIYFKNEETVKKAIEILNSET